MPSHPVDVHVGSRLRALRVERNLSQTALANAVGITFQQIQKYERGDNRLSMSRAHDIAAFFGINPGDFFEGLELATKRGVSPDSAALAFAASFDGRRVNRKLASISTNKVLMKAIEDHIDLAIKP